MGKFLKFILKPEIFFIFILFISFSVYFSTMSGGINYWDTGEFQTVFYTLNIPHPTGFPTYLLLGKLFTTIFPFGSIAWRANLLSVLLSSFGIYLFSLSSYSLTKKYFLSIAAGFFLITNPYLWSVATAADPHSLNFFFFTLIFYFIVQILKKDKFQLLPLTAFILGLSLGNHLLSLFFIPPILLILLCRRKKLNPKLLPLSLLLFFSGLSVYIILFFIGKIKTPLGEYNSWINLKEYIGYITGSDFNSLMNEWTKGNFKDTVNYFYNISLNFFGAELLIMSLAGLIIMFLIDKEIWLFTIPVFLGILFFSLRYQNGFLERYFIIPHIIFIIGFLEIPLLIKRYILKVNKHKLKIFNLLLTISAVGILILQGVINLSKYYSEKNLTKNMSASYYADEIFKNIDNNGVVFSWWSYSTPLWYKQKIEGKRTDIKIINANQRDWETEALKYITTKPVYFIEEIQVSNKDYMLTPEGNVFRYKKS